MLIDPWGNILSQLDSGEGFVSGIVDLASMTAIRTNLPALKHKQLN